MVANLKKSTGKTMAQWLKITKASKLEKHGQIVKLLKAEHGMTHGYANLVAHETLQSGANNSNSDDLIGNQYAGKKEALLPIYKALIAAISKFGKDVEIAPKKSYVSLRRNKQFALIQPSTATRVDVGICSKDLEPSERFELSGSFNSMCSHRVRLFSTKDVNPELIRWLKAAYVAS